MTSEVRLPRQAEDIDESLISFWHVQEGDQVEKGDPLVEVQTEKAVADVQAPESGVLSKIIKERSDTAKVDEVLALISDSMPESDEAETEEEKVEEKIKATPKVKKFAKDQGVNWQDIRPAKGNKLTEADVKKFLKENEEGASEEEKEDAEKRQEFIPLSGVRKAIADNLTKTIQEVPHVTHFQEAKVDRLVSLREELKEDFAKEELHLTYLPFVVKALVHSLKKYSYLNGQFDAENEQIILNKDFHIGIAVDTENGLVVPVIRHADKKSLAEITEEIQSLAEKAREGRLTADDMSGGSITISNVGSASGSFFTPIINAPEAAILGIGRITKKMMVVKDQGEIQSIMPLSLSYDHRLIDGLLAQEALNELSRLLNKPSLLLAKD